MPADEADKVDDNIDDQNENEEGLDVIEKTLADMRGDDSYDDNDEGYDEPEEETQAEEGEVDSPEGVRAESGDTEKEETEGKDQSDGDKPDVDDPDADDSDVSDEDDDKLRESMNEKTASRFDHFRNTNKELNTKFDEVNESYTELKRSTDVMNHYINDSNITPEQLSTALTMAKAMNSGDFEVARAAFPRMKEWMNSVAVGLGDNSAQVQLPDDLKEAVNNLDITPELAQQQAMLRGQTAQRQQYNMQAGQQQHQQQQRQQQQQQYEQQMYDEAQQAAQAIDVWERKTASTDPEFKIKRDKMLSRSEAIMQNNPPSSWAGLLQEQYELISEVMNDNAEQARRQSNKNQGIRPGAGGGSSRSAFEAAPKSFEENFNATLKSMRG